MVMDASEYEELQGRVRGLLISVADQLPPVTARLVAEMIDANECGVALETMSEMLVESGAVLSGDIVAIVDGLVQTMGLDSANVARLRPLAR
jgi:hypothetical protein